MHRRAQSRRLRRIIPAAGVVLVAGLVLVAGACGGQATDPTGAAQEPATEAATPAAATPEPVSGVPPLVNMGDTVRFRTPEGAVVSVTAAGYADPGDAPDGVTAEAGERIVTLELTVAAEDPEGTAAVEAPFRKADSFLLIAEDDTITVARPGDDALLGAILPPGESLSTTLAFSVGASSPMRFVCTPVEGSRPRSATWKLD